MSDQEVEHYISSSPQEVQPGLRELRKLVMQVVPEAVEGFAYGMPAYKLNGKPLFYFAAFANHIGIYATPNTHASFASKVQSYKQGKGSVQFPIGASLPFDLVGEMIGHRAQEIRQAIGSKRKPKASKG